MIEDTIYLTSCQNVFSVGVVSVQSRDHLDPIIYFLYIDTRHVIPKRSSQWRRNDCRNRKVKEVFARNESVYRTIAVACVTLVVVAIAIWVAVADAPDAKVARRGVKFSIQSARLVYTRHGAFFFC